MHQDYTKISQGAEPIYMPQNMCTAWRFVCKGEYPTQDGYAFESADRTPDVVRNHQGGTAAWDNLCRTHGINLEDNSYVSAQVISDPNTFPHTGKGVLFSIYSGRSTDKMGNTGVRYFFASEMDGNMAGAKLMAKQLSEYLAISYCYVADMLTRVANGTRESDPEAYKAIETMETFAFITNVKQNGHTLKGLLTPQARARAA